MPASPLVTRRRLVVALVALVLAVAAVVAVVTLRSNAEATAGASSSASPTATDTDAKNEDEGEAAGPEADAPSQGGSAPAGSEDAGSDDTGAEADEPAAPEPRETLDPAPFGAEVTPEPGVTVTVPSVKKVTGEANVPGEVGGPALRFAVELTNGTGKVLDLRTVVVNAYFGPERTPAAPLLKPGGKAFEAEVAVDGSASGAFVFSVPSEFQDEVELEVDAGIGKAIAIFTGA